MKRVRMKLPPGIAYAFWGQCENPSCESKSNAKHYITVMDEKEESVITCQVCKLQTRAEDVVTQEDEIQYTSLDDGMKRSFSFTEITGYDDKPKY